MRRKPGIRRRKPFGAARNGGTRAWAKLSKEYAGQTCWLRLPGCTVVSTGADHYWPVATHPHLEMVRSNLRPACRHCNTARRHTHPHMIDRLRAKMANDPKYKPRTALEFFR